MDKITYKSIKKMPEVNAYIEQGNRVLGILGYTEHSRGHAVKVAETAGDILEKLGYNEHTVEPVSYTHLDVYKRQCIRRAVLHIRPLRTPKGVPFLPVSAPFLTLTSLVRLVAKRNSPSQKPDFQSDSPCLFILSK